MSDSPEINERGARRRMILRSVIVAFVVISAWIGVLVGWLLLREEPYNFSKEIDRTMRMISSGQSSELYEESSPRMRKAYSENTFVERATEINQTLGNFKEVTGTSDAVIHDRAQGKTGWVRASLRFEKNDKVIKATGSFSWHWDPTCEREDQKKKGCWRLFGYYVELPPKIAATRPDWSQFESAHSEAPAEVVAMVRDILGKLRDGKLREVYDAADPSFRTTVPFEQFEARAKVRAREMGSYEHILDITSSGKDEESHKAWVTAVIEYSKAQTTGTMDFWNTDGTWRLSRFMIAIPEVQIPRRPPPPPGSQTEDAGSPPAP